MTNRRDIRRPTQQVDNTSTPVTDATDPDALHQAATLEDGAEQLDNTSTPVTDATDPDVLHQADALEEDTRLKEEYLEKDEGPSYGAQGLQMSLSCNAAGLDPIIVRKTPTTGLRGRYTSGTMLLVTVTLTGLLTIATFSTLFNILVGICAALIADGLTVFMLYRTVLSSIEMDSLLEDCQTDMTGRTNLRRGKYWPIYLLITLEVLFNTGMLTTAVLNGQAEKEVMARHELQITQLRDKKSVLQAGFDSWHSHAVAELDKKLESLRIDRNRAADEIGGVKGPGLSGKKGPGTQTSIRQQAANETAAAVALANQVFKTEDASRRQALKENLADADRQIAARINQGPEKLGGTGAFKESVALFTRYFSEAPAIPVGLLALDMILILLGYMPVELKLRYAQNTWRDEYWEAWYEETGRKARDDRVQALADAEDLAEAERAAKELEMRNQAELDAIQHRTDVAEAERDALARETDLLKKQADQLGLHNAARATWMKAKLESARLEKQFALDLEAIENGTDPLVVAPNPSQTTI